MDSADRKASAIDSESLKSSHGESSGNLKGEKDVVKEVVSEVKHVMTQLAGEYVTDQKRIIRLWRKFNPDSDSFTRGVRPTFFKKLAFAEDSGFGDIPNLTNPESVGGVSLYMRAFYAMLLGLFCIYNVLYLSWYDAVYLPSCQANAPQGFLLSRILLNRLLGVLGMRLHDPSTCQERWVGFLELLGLLVLLFRIGRNVMIALCPRVFSQCSRSVLRLFMPKYTERRWCGSAKEQATQERWFAVTRLFFGNLPELSGYSGMKLLHWIQPWVVSKDVCWILYNEAPEKTRWLLANFLLTRIAAFVVGFDLFCVRFRGTLQSVCVSDEELSFHDIVVCVLFVKQVLGIVQVDVLIRERLLLFVFAGEDSILDSDERSIMLVWHAMVAHGLWNVTKGRAVDSACESGAPTSVTRLGLLKFFIIMMSFSDEDVQKLVLEEKPQRKGLHETWTRNDSDSPHQISVSDSLDLL